MSIAKKYDTEKKNKVILVLIINMKFTSQIWQRMT